jgi:phosphatidate cytidylyltransferase
MSETPSKPKSDLKIRSLSAVAMIAVAGIAIWAGGWIFVIFVALIASGLLYEWWGLVSKITERAELRLLSMAIGIAYVGFAVFALIDLRSFDSPLEPWGGVSYVMIWIGAVVCVDVGAYFAGRAIGGPKIAPKISPNKTWAGLFGGYLAVLLFSVVVWSMSGGFHWLTVVKVAWAVCAGFAVIAQAGDFLESWMKRRAGVKDSGSLIPGHGGLFDRLDGLIAVSAILGVVGLLK